MKFLLVGIIVALGTIGATAQSSYELKRGYTGNVELIGGVPEIGLSTTQGYRVNQYWSFGINTGINLNNEVPYIPFRPVVQLSAPLGENGTIFVNSMYGVALSLDKWENTSKWGLSFNFGTGIRYRRMTYQIALDAENLEYTTAEHRNVVYRGFGSLQIRIGYTFGAR